MEKACQKISITWIALTILCCLCYHGSFEPGEPSPPGHIKLTKVDRDTVYGKRGYDKMWRVVKQNLQRCQRHHNVILKTPNAEFKKSENYSLDESVGSDKSAVSFEKRQLCYYLLTREGLWAKVNDDRTSESEKAQARKALCDYYLSEEPRGSQEGIGRKFL